MNCLTDARKELYDLACFRQSEEVDNFKSKRKKLVIQVFLSRPEVATFSSSSPVYEALGCDDLDPIVIRNPNRLVISFTFHKCYECLVSISVLSYMLQVDYDSSCVKWKTKISK